MTRRRATIGLCMLCALIVSAFAAQGAAAVTKGTTAFTCAATVGGVGFSKEHCKPEDAVASGATFKHVEIAENTTTEITLSNAKTNAATNGPTNTVLKSTIAGLGVELTATGVSTPAPGSLTNAKDPVTGEHYVHGSAVLTYTGITVAPAALECQVFEYNPKEPEEMGPAGMITTEPLSSTTKGQGHFLQFTPTTGTVFAKFWFTGCKNAGLNGLKEVTGSVKCPTDGATIVCSHAATTEQNTLKFGGNKAGINGSLTVTGKHPGILNDPYKPISVTTVETS